MAWKRTKSEGRESLFSGAFSRPSSDDRFFKLKRNTLTKGTQKGIRAHLLIAENFMLKPCVHEIRNRDPGLRVV